MSERDDDLARALVRSVDAIPIADPDAALTRIIASSRVVRRRRMAVRAGAALTAAALVGAVWLGARPPGSTQVDTVDSPSTATSPSTAGTTPSSAVTAGEASTTATAVPTTTATGPTASAVPATTTPSAAAPPPVTAAPPPGATPTTVPPPSSGPSTYGGLGGQVTVRVDAGTLVLVNVSPAAGYAVTEQKSSSDEVEVRFEGSAGRTRVRVRLEGGALSPEVKEDGPS